MAALVYPRRDQRVEVMASVRNMVIFLKKKKEDGHRLLFVILMID